MSLTAAPRLDLPLISPAEAHGFRHIAVIGCGLVGGSIALAARDMGLGVTVFDTDPSTRAVARAAGLDTTDTAGDAVTDADLVIIATHADQVMTAGGMLRPFIRPGTIVTDTASVKGLISAGLDALLSPTGAIVVPGHPMAGKAVSGFEAADANLFHGCTWILTPGRASGEPYLVQEATQRLAALISDWGAARVVDVHPDNHDLLVGLISHLPQLSSSALAATIGRFPEAAAAVELAGGGFRDSTRIAASPWGMWRPIVAENSGILSLALDQLIATLTEMRDAITQEDPEVLPSVFHDAQAVRARWSARTETQAAKGESDGHH